ncbi:MAG: zinc ABC transporter substrate-binding protein [Desulfohalobiaceae bacterium]|nr:zinc ABC transporter substrate-binding protein [Desulfohalobiaceae bacterium]
MKAPFFFSALLAILLLQTTAMAKILVFASVSPQQYFLQQLGGDLLEVRVMVRPGANPATFEPSPGQMVRLAKAKAYFAIGVPFENTWLKRITAANSDLEIVHTDQGIRKRSMSPPQHHHDQDQTDSLEDRGSPDPHIWLSPELVKIQARNSYRGLVRLDPDHSAVYKANLDDFLKELDRMQETIHSILEPLPEDRRSFMVFHPAWGYFAQEFGLRQVPIQAEGKEPGPGQLASTIRHGREEAISVIFVQPQFSDKSARVIARELEAEVAVLDPLADDWRDNLFKAAQAFRQALEDRESTS